jgi:hypothetical protein
MNVILLTVLLTLLGAKGIKKKPMSEEQKMIRSKKIAIIDKNGDIISEYYGIKKCANDLNLNHRRIRDVLSGRLKSYKDMYFKYI